jgi:hypothetical protein
VCTYQTERVALRGSGKGATGWFSVREATIYVDHPVHAPDPHTLNVDLRNPDLGPSARVALELDAASARALAEAIVHALERAPAGLLEPSPASQRA